MTQDYDPPPSADDTALADFLDAAFARYAAGDTVRAADLLADTPHLIPAGERLLADVDGLFAVAVGLRADSQALDPADGPPPPDLLPDDFRVVRRLGRGSFGEVWLADDRHLGRPVALKVIRPAGDATTAAALVARLRDEARLLAAVRHPNVVPVYAWREAVGPDGTPHPILVQRYISGGSLADRVRTGGPLGWATATGYVADAADGLAAVHAAGVIHRDIKPANILWDPDADEALLTDFGISTRLAEAPPAGTLAFMPPEAFTGVVGPAQDVYGLAATLFWLATGEHPFPGRTAGALAEQCRRGLPDPDRRLAALPDRVDAVIRRGLVPDPKARPGLPAFAADLRGVLNQTLADGLAAPAPFGGLRLAVSRQAGPYTFLPLAASRPEPGNLLRDLKRVPAESDRATARTGDRVRIEVEPPAAGHLTVFNVGPTGNLHVLFPERSGGGAVAAGQPVYLPDIALTPPAGDERLVAVWTREAVPLRPDDLRGLVDGDFPAPPPEYRATRDMKRLDDAVRAVDPGGRAVAVLTLRHVPHGG